jgi:saccharopine dehydrogenase-like NADP-dependent oxidoreductase
MKKILLFGAGKSATCLIRYLVRETGSRGWQLVVAEVNLSLAESKIGAVSHARAVTLRVEDEQEREDLVSEADIIISLLPPSLHFLVAMSCVKCKKNLLTASYLDDKIKALEPAIRENGLLFVGEMGLDPGIDHMSAMQLIHRIREDGGRILSFRSHTGGLVAPESDDNPWHYKISWNPRNVVTAGSAGASYRLNKQTITCSYADIFENCAEVTIQEAGTLGWYPNRDSLSYIPLYGLSDADTFIRTTLRHPVFCAAWKSIVRAGLTEDKRLVFETGLSFASWSAPILPFVHGANREQLEFLWLFDASPVPSGAHSSADILQYLLETRLAMRPDDKDMIVMQHEIQFVKSGDPTEDRQEEKSTLVVKGEDQLETAMAKTVGLPLGITAKLILEGEINLTGLHIPILPVFYTPVLKELEAQGIRFEKTIN